jgi:hypothetical protein
MRPDNDALYREQLRGMRNAEPAERAHRDDGFRNAIVMPTLREIVAANYEASLRKRQAIIEAVLDRGLA